MGYRSVEETRSISLHDPLTGLANRRSMVIHLEKRFEEARRYEGKLSLIMLDIDHFKKYNDTHGHVAGDKMLAKVANVLQREIRSADLLFRYGGEEFLAILPHTDMTMACEAAERLRMAVESDVGVTISLGVASCRETIEDKESLVSLADDALYRAKQKGRNRVEGAFDNARVCNCCAGI
ncbi:MAG: response regulator [Geobacteraceae bacterium]|nr:MAG: response regulator [Geobacteraceae bacterium]